MIVTAPAPVRPQPKKQPTSRWKWAEVVVGVLFSRRITRPVDDALRLAQAIAAVDVELARHFALAPGQANPNELPDRADLR